LSTRSGALVPAVCIHRPESVIEGPAVDIPSTTSRALSRAGRRHRWTRASSGRSVIAAPPPYDDDGARRREGALADDASPRDRRFFALTRFVRAPHRSAGLRSRLTASPACPRTVVKLPT
jgi:hypothetical protein